MEVKVDSRLIRSMREDRGWSQDHLATAAGLSLRTIQRIEKTGSASLESVTALASVFSVQVAHLRVKETEPSRERAIRLSLELPIRLALAVVSGALCALLLRWSYTVWFPDLGWFDYGLAGALFGVTVLCPYLRSRHGLMMRAFALIAASALSYFCAVTTVANADAWFSISSALTTFLLASFIGVAIVLVAAKVLIPLRVTAAYWFLGLVASLLGGAAMYVGLETFANSTATTIAAYCTWHMLACFAIHRGRHPSDAQTGLLAALVRTRGRFSIVPGWMKLSHSTVG